ncbi:SDR family oxidoreductase [Oscillatoria sp. FACHB-1407]|uniref:SDR family NAD(P)-dependent oxidoreductase n=1 Tax=Oscillatoria sp. FACHB-1407 TaxID=2692847 RepID=UPI001683AA63|nr:SDR family oxidoreductase [Oscillatoria sp. FACHB-1407]MBD2463673.1 SDR family oxidoreductase [Oscillatoria sp. FACHB-1407]
MATIVIFGASRGVGLGCSIGLPDPGDTVFLISRTRPPSLDRSDQITRIWIPADLSIPKMAATTVSEAIGDRAVDFLFYNAGIWEKDAFEPAYSFEQSTIEEMEQIIQVNLLAAILCTHQLIPNLKRSVNPRVVYMSSLSGLDNSGAPEVANTASKFGLRGVVHALRECLRDYRIPVTALNPGNIAAEIDYDAGAEAAVQTYDGTQIPMQDLVLLLRCLRQLTRVSCVKEIDIPAMPDLYA